MMTFEIRRTLRKVQFVLWIATALLVLAGCGGSEEHAVSAEVQQDMMTRWNVVAEGVVVPGFGGFKWEAFDQFPHPTYKGGSQEAYRLFAGILVAFYEKDDNFDYLTANQCFSVTLRVVFSSGQEGLHTSFAQLTDDFSRNEWIAAETREKLTAFAARIRAAQ